LAGLVDRSFLRRNGAGRYEIHELLRQYGKEKLAAKPDENDRIYDLHCGYYADFLHQREGHLKGGKQQEALIEIGDEIENVRSAWDWATKWGKVEQIGKCLQGLLILYEARSWYREGEEAFRTAADRLEEADGRGEEPTGERRKVLGHALSLYGNFCFRLGNYRHSKELFQKGLNILRPAGQDSLPAITYYLGLLATVNWHTGDYLEGKELAQESLATSRECGDRFSEVHVLAVLGLIALTLGKYTQARRFFQESLAISQEIGEQRAKAIGLAGLGWVTQVQGDYLESKKLIQESLAICREISLIGVPYCLDLLGTLAYRMGDYTEAKQWHQESLEISRKVDERWSMACALSHLGDATCALGEYYASGRYFRDALTTSMEIGTAQVTLSALVGLATLFSTNKPGDTQRQWAIELLALAQNHPSSTQETKDRAVHLLAELEPQSSPKAVAIAQERGRTSNLETVVLAVLEELSDEAR
jgi:tetratricopeptide (TPR) repeat protein